MDWADVEASLDPDHGRVAVRARFQVDRARLWQGLTTEKDLSAWLGRPDGLPTRMGARFLIRHDDATVSEHRVTRWRPYRLLGWSWAVPAEDDSAITFAATPQGDGTVLTLQHLGLVDLPAHAVAWSDRLRRLDEHLRGVAPTPPANPVEPAGPVQRCGSSHPAAVLVSRRVGP